MITGPLSDFCGISKGNSIKEMSTVPTQQIIRTYNYKINNLSKKDIEEINMFYPNCQFNIYTYRQSISDSMRACLNTELVKEKPLDYLKLYAKLGLSNLEDYTEAFLINNLGLLYLGKQYQDDRMYHPYIEYNMLDAKKWNSNYIQIKRESLFPQYEEILNNNVKENGWTKIPGISIIFTAAFYFLISIISTFMIIHNKNWKMFIPLTLVLGYFLTIMFAPVILFRYIYPIVLCSPLIIMTCFKLIYKKNK